MRRTERNIIIFGCGGVGSWVALYLAKKQLNKDVDLNLTLIDFDIIEEKNMERQFFNINDISCSKTTQLKSSIRRHGLSTANILAKNLKIEKKEELLQFDNNSVAILCTDNAKSKILISKYFNKFIIVNCDYDFVEVKSQFEEDELKMWDINNGGYSNRQNINSNLKAALIVLNLFDNNLRLRFEKFKIVTTVESEMQKMVRAGNLVGDVE